MPTCWYRESRWVVPVPPSQASHAPEWGGSTDALLILAVVTHGDGLTEPFSNPVLPSSSPPPDMTVNGVVRMGWNEIGLQVHPWLPHTRVHWKPRTSLAPVELFDGTTYGTWKEPDESGMAVPRSVMVPAGSLKEMSTWQ